jgi:hypothetical protein
MPALRELQQAFSNAVFTGDADGCAAWIRANGLSGERRLQVYRNNMYTTLTASLQASYPVVQRLVGEGFFRYAAHQYLAHHPSTAGNLHDFGGHFADFLADFPPAASLAYLPDVARLEWACEQVYQAAETALLDLAALAAVPADQQGDLRFRLSPAIRLLASDYPVLRIWQVNQPAQTGEPVVDLAAGGDPLLIYRDSDLEVVMQPLAAGEFALLQALAAGRNFADACAEALTVQPDGDLPAWFRRQLGQGTLSEFYL